MGQIKVTKCPIEGLYIIEPTVHGDSRGYFMETYNQQDFEAVGLNMKFVQDNQSLSTKGVLRGLHFQKKYPSNLWDFFAAFFHTFCHFFISNIVNRLTPPPRQVLIYLYLNKRRIL